MQTFLAIYLIFVALMLTTTLPVLGECLTELFDRNESFWNRRAAAYWIVLCVLLCLFWPLTLIAVVGIFLLETRGFKP